MDYIGNNTIANVILKKVPEELFGKKLSEAHLLREKDILILLVERRAVEVEAARSEPVLMPGDRLTVFGPYHNISQVFQAEERFS